MAEVTFDFAETVRENAGELAGITSRLQYAVEAKQWMDACKAFGQLAAVVPELAADIAQNAYNVPGTTKKSIADAMRIPPRDLAGLTRT